MLPTLEQTLTSFAGATVFSKLDCNCAFLQIPLSEESQLLTTYLIPFGRFCWRRLPFGLSASSEHYQHRISAIFEGIESVVCLIDDSLVSGRNQEKYDARLHRVLKRLRDNGIKVNDICIWSVSSLRYVGHVISADGIRPDPDKVAAIMDMPAPTNVSKVRCVLGMINQ